MKHVLGIDLGSRTTKIVRLTDGALDHTDIFDTGHDPLPKVREKIRKLGDSLIVATGYGRHLLRENLGALHVTEIKACARGALHLCPSSRSILDMGGQDCKVIELGEKGRVIDFEMNDRCAAGTGRFIEVMAGTFELGLEAFIKLACSATEHIPISSMCTVFAESEVVSLITSGKPKDKIAFGVHVAIADRLASMLSRFAHSGEVLFVGGGAKNDCLHALLERKIGREIIRPGEPQIVIALGAALLAEEIRNQS